MCFVNQVTMPVRVQHTVFLVRVSVLETSIGCLASRQFTRLSGAVLDMVNMEISFTAIPLLHVPMFIVDGHLAVCITDWPIDMPQDLDAWPENDLDFTGPPGTTTQTGMHAGVEVKVTHETEDEKFYDCIPCYALDVDEPNTLENSQGEQLDLLADSGQLDFCATL